MKHERFMIRLFRLFSICCIPTFAQCEWKGFEPKVSWSGEAELLIFKPYLENLDYGEFYTYTDLAVSEVPHLALYIPNNIYSGVSSQEIKRPIFEYRPGFRAKINGCLINYGLNSAIVWTNFHSSSENKYEALMLTPSDGTFFKAPPSIVSYGVPLGDPLLSTSPIATTSLGSYSISFDQGDLLFSRKLSLFNRLTIEPTVGLTLVKIKQKLKQNYILSYSAPDYLDISENRVRDDALRFEGVGTRAGFTTGWNIFPEINLVGGLSGALYYGEFTVRQSTSLQSLEALESNLYPAAQILVSEENRFQDVRFAGSAHLGLEYVFHFNYDRLSVHVTASWEGHWFPSQNVFGAVKALGSVGNLSTTNLNNIVDNSNKPSIIGGDLSLSGWVVGAKVCF